MVCKVYRNEVVKKEKKKKSKFSECHLHPQPTESKTGIGSKDGV